ncbi:hypothetical protein OIV83_005799 [Microbotryomycetes sp. JL201]|nr:hypothetical protein OIV83_005799 [Microbotryomycetes sp. JL201]
MDLPPHAPGVYQQRPSLSYFVFLTMLLFMLSNNGSSGVTNDDRARIEQRLTDALHLRQAKREGLAQWLGIGNQTRWDEMHPTSKLLDNGTRVSVNQSSFAQVIPFEPRDHVNDAVLPLLRDLLDDDLTDDSSHQAYYAQNLTGFVRGEWTFDTDWTYDRLRLPESYNTTQQREEKPETKDNSPDEAGQKSQLEPEEPPSDRVGGPFRRLRRRQEGDEHDAPASAEDSAASAGPKLVNVTVTTNRTEQRHQFPFTAGGKVSFNVREEQTSAVGPILPLTPDWQDGRLLEMRPGGPQEPWEQAGPVTYLHAKLTMTSNDGDHETVLDIESLHFLAQGTVYGFVTPTWARSHLFDSVGLPAFDKSFKANLSSVAAGHGVLREVDRRIARDVQELEEGTWITREDNSAVAPGEDDASSTTVSRSAPECIFALYGALRPMPPSYPPNAYAEYYRNLFHPTGSSVPSPPTPIIDFVLYSDNCGLVLSGHAEVLSTSRLWNHATNYALLTGLSQLAILLLLVRQMERGGPGSTAKLAHTTIAVQAAVDAYFFIIQFTVGIVTNNRSSMPLLAPAFFALVSSLVFGMRYASSIRAAAPPLIPRRPIASPAPPPPTAQQLAARAAEARASSADEEETAPLVVAPLPATEEESDLPYLFFGIVVAVLLVSIIFIWGWLAFLIVLIYSYWIPQIVLNVQRGAARQTLRREYIIGTTIARLVLPVYLWGYKDNVLALEPSPWILALVLYSTVQAGILLAQDSRFGARFFLPRAVQKWFALAQHETWDYHPVLVTGLLSTTPAELEAGSTSSSIKPRDVLDSDGKHAKEDCPICLSKVQIVPSKQDELDGNDVNKLKWSYMVPPCGHIAHSECLEHWLEVKSQCPVCRARLPPL